MDSRPHDDFLQPDPAIIDDVSHASGGVVASEQVALGEALVDGAGASHLDDPIDELELELASLMMPDLDAMDLEEPDADPRASAIASPPNDAGMSGPVMAPEAMIEEEAGRPIVEAAIAARPDTTDMPFLSGVASAESETIVAEADALAETDMLELELAFDAMAADMLADEPETAAEDVAAAGEPEAAPAEAIVVSQVDMVADSTTPELVSAGDGTQAVALPAVDAVSADDAVESSPRALDAVPEDRLAAEPEATIDDARNEPGAPEAVLARAIVESQPVTTSEASPAGDDTRASDTGLPIEAQTFEQALESQDILAVGFEAAVRGAADRSQARFLFQMPVHTVHDCQRVAAVNLAGGETPATVLVLLQADGRSVRMEDARESDNPFAGMAVSYGGLLAHLKSLPTRAAA